MIAFKKFFGFTLLELITVITLIAIILLINSPHSKKKKVGKTANSVVVQNCNSAPTTDQASCEAKSPEETKR
ncbi:MAG: hypothetical protein RL637_1402 [Pseudomonadota bacterium]|jgi:prepilin-type N-terminal cleavage/methylation domain-containing protein